MSQRVFYIVHLDKARIASLAVIITGLLLTAFATGYRAGNTTEPIPTYSQNHDIFSEPESKVSEKSDHNLVESEDQQKPEDRSVDLLASKEVDTPPKQRVNLLDSALDNDLDLQPSTEVSRKSDTKTDSTTTKTKTSTQEPAKKIELTKKDSQKKEITKKTIKKTKVTIKETKKQKPEPVVKKEKKSEIYVLQMGAYQSREAALRLSDQIRKHGIQTYVLKTGNIHTVRTEAVSDRRQLFQTEKKLKSLRFSPITVMLKGNN